MVVFPAFALPIIRTRNLISGFFICSRKSRRQVESVESKAYRWKGLSIIAFLSKCVTAVTALTGNVRLLLPPASSVIETEKLPSTQQSNSSDVDITQLPIP
jgi:hypothetical protein